MRTSIAAILILLAACDGGIGPNGDFDTNPPCLRAETDSEKYGTPTALGPCITNVRTSSVGVGNVTTILADRYGGGTVVITWDNDTIVQIT